MTKKTVIIIGASVLALGGIAYLLLRKKSDTTALPGATNPDGTPAIAATDPLAEQRTYLIAWAGSGTNAERGKAAQAIIATMPANDLTSLYGIVHDTFNKGIAATADVQAEWDRLSGVYPISNL